MPNVIRRTKYKAAQWVVLSIPENNTRFQSSWVNIYKFFLFILFGCKWVISCIFILVRVNVNRLTVTNKNCHGKTILLTWKTVTVAQRRESKFFLSQRPVLGSQNMQPNSCIPRILKSHKLISFVKLKLQILTFSHLKINMKRDRRPKNTTTLSMVLNMTTSCL